VIARTDRRNDSHTNLHNPPDFSHQPLLVERQCSAQ
jgi:hypothetical protein